MGLPRANILVLMFFLVVHMVSPLCHGIASGSPVPAATGFQLPTDSRESVPPLGEPAEHCWFQTAHLFNKAWTPDATGALTIQFLFAAFTILTVFFISRKECPATQYFLPDRSPPTRALLQIFRI